MLLIVSLTLLSFISRFKERKFVSELKRIRDKRATKRVMAIWQSKNNIRPDNYSLYPILSHTWSSANEKKGTSDKLVLHWQRLSLHGSTFSRAKSMESPVPLVPRYSRFTTRAFQNVWLPRFLLHSNRCT